MNRGLSDVSRRTDWILKIKNRTPGPRSFSRRNAPHGPYPFSLLFRALVSRYVLTRASSSFHPHLHSDSSSRRLSSSYLRLRRRATKARPHFPPRFRENREGAARRVGRRIVRAFRAHRCVSSCNALYRGKTYEIITRVNRPSR